MSSAVANMCLETKTVPDAQGMQSKTMLATVVHAMLLAGLTHCSTTLMLFCSALWLLTVLLQPVVPQEGNHGISLLAYTDFTLNKKTALPAVQGLCPRETISGLCLRIFSVLGDVVDPATGFTVLEVGEQDHEHLVHCVAC